MRAAYGRRPSGIGASYFLPLLRAAGGKRGDRLAARDPSPVKDRMQLTNSGVKELGW